MHARHSKVCVEAATEILREMECLTWVLLKRMTTCAAQVTHKNLFLPPLASVERHSTCVQKHGQPLLIITKLFWSDFSQQYKNIYLFPPLFAQHIQRAKSNGARHFTTVDIATLLQAHFRSAVARTACCAEQKQSEMKGQAEVLTKLIKCFNILGRHLPQPSSQPAKSPRCFTDTFIKRGSHLWVKFLSKEFLMNS